MKVVLLQDVKGQGQKGDIINAAEGYARNFLIPRNLAVVASESKLKELSDQKAAQIRKKEREEDDARQMAARLEGLKVVVKTKAGEGGRLFGAVSNKDIAENLAQQHGINIDKKKIVLKEPIKSQGEHSVNIRLHPSVQASVNVLVQGE